MLASIFASVYNQGKIVEPVHSSSLFAFCVFIITVTTVPSLHIALV
jgi:hypothetical protein